MKTYISKSLEAASNVAQYDTHAKRLLSDKQILAWILKSATDEFQNLPIQNIVNCIEGEIQISDISVMPGETNLQLQQKRTDSITGLKNEDAIPYEGIITYDIRFYVTLPDQKTSIKILFNIEAQKDFYPGYDIVTRGIFYTSRMISSQLDTEFTIPHYNDIKKVYSIWICMNAPAYIGNALTTYTFSKRDVIGQTPDKKESYDKSTVILLYLNEKADISDGSIHHLLNALFSQEMLPSEKQKVLSEEYQIKTDNALGEELNDMCNLGEGIWEKGLETGIQKGLSQGIQSGIVEKTKIVIKNMLNRGMSDDDIYALAECTQDMIDEVRNELNS